MSPHQGTFGLMTCIIFFWSLSYSSGGKKKKKRDETDHMLISFTILIIKYTHVCHCTETHGKQESTRCMQLVCEGSFTTLPFAANHITNRYLPRLPPVNNNINTKEKKIMVKNSSMDIEIVIKSKYGSWAADWAAGHVSDRAKTKSARPHHLVLQAWRRLIK